jgi:hypothetical protein
VLNSYSLQGLTIPPSPKDIRRVTYQVINHSRGNVKIAETFDKGHGV